MVNLNDEIEVTLVPRDERVVAQDVWPETGFVRSGSESTESCVLEEHGVCNGPQEDGESVEEQDQIPGEPVLVNAPQGGGKLLYRCQGLTCDMKNQGRRCLDLVPGDFPFEDGYGYTRDVCADCWTELYGGRSPVRKYWKEAGATT